MDSLKMRVPVGEPAMEFPIFFMVVGCNPSSPALSQLACFEPRQHGAVEMIILKAAPFKGFLRRPA